MEDHSQWSGQRRACSDTQVSSPGFDASCGNRMTGRRFIVATLNWTTRVKVIAVIPGKPGKN